MIEDILKHCDRTISFYQGVEERLKNHGASPSAAQWVIEEFEKLKAEISRLQEYEAKKMAEYFQEN